MAFPERLWQRLVKGCYLWPGQRAYVADRVPLGDESRVHELATAMHDLPTPLMRSRAAEALLQVARTPVIREIGHADTIALVVEALSPSAHSDGRLLDGGERAVWRTHRAAVGLVPHLFGWEHELRTLICGPPLPLRSVPLVDSSREAYGAKLAALDLLAHRLGGADAGILLGMTANAAEPSGVRDAAALLLVRLAGPEAVRCMARHLLTYPSTVSAHVPDWPPAQRRAMVAPLVAGLEDRSSTTRMRARALLEGVGSLAYRELMVLARTTTCPATREHTTVLLLRIDRRALLEIAVTGGPNARSLSPALPAGSDAARGLSRSEERTDA